MADKVHRGTTPFKRLCDTCTAGMVIQDESTKDVVFCSNLPTGCNPLRLRVVRCTEYKDKTENYPSLRVMQDMAYVLTEDTPMKTAGFVSSREWRKKHKEEPMLPPDKAPAPWDI